MTRGAQDVLRERDEEVLRMVRLRSRGWSPSQIAERLGIDDRGSVSNLTARIRDDDVRECQTVWPGDDPASVESEADVLAGYWKRLRAPRRAR